MGTLKHMTLAMIASEVGVSVATVSRVLNAPTREEARRWAAEKTIKRIHHVAQQSDYRPNPQAVGLRKQKTDLLGMVVPRLQDYVLATIYEGVDEAASKHGYATVTANSLDDPNKRLRAVESLLARRVEGLVIGDAPADGEFVAWLRKKTDRFVLVSRRVEGAISATTDDLLGGELAGGHLVEQGCTTFAIVGGQPFASTAIERIDGFIGAVEKHGLEVDPAHIVYGPFDADGGRAAAEQLVAQKDPLPDCVFATNDFAAIGAMGALRDHGIRVPEDVLVVGYNDTPLAANLPVPLTSVSSSMHEMGQAGFGLLREVISGEEPESIRLKPSLRVRESSTGLRNILEPT